MADWYKADFLNELKKRGRIPIERLPEKESLDYTNPEDYGWWNLKTGYKTAAYLGECADGIWNIYILLEPVPGLCSGANPPEEPLGCISYAQYQGNDYDFGEDGPIPEDCAKQAIDLLYSYAPSLIELLFPRLHGNLTPRLTCLTNEEEPNKIKCLIPRLAAVLKL